MRTFVTSVISIALGLVVAALGTSVLTQPAGAQVLYGSIVGAITDASGAGVARAGVVAIREATGQTREGTTDEGGRFVLQDVWPGSYSVKVSASGFRALLNKNVIVTGNNVTRVDVQLELGSVTEEITVAAHSTAIQTDKADVHVDIVPEVIADLPLPAYRNFETLISLVPGASTPYYVGAIGDSPERSLSFNVNGGQVYTNNTRVDGAVDMQIFTPSHALIVPPTDAIESVNIVTNAYDADQGMTGTMAVTVTTKSGTNQLHGSAFEFHNNQHLLARDFFATAKPVSITNIGGGTVGGPIRKNKLFFFGSWEGTFQRLGMSGLYTVPTADQRNGNFSAYNAAIYDPATGNPDGTGRTPFPNATVPQDRISPIMQKVQNLILSPNLPGTATNLFSAQNQVMNRNNVDAKVTWNPVSSLTLWGKYSVMDALVTCPGVLGAAGGGAAGGLSAGAGATGCDPTIGHTLAQMATFAQTWTISPSLVLDSTLGFSRMGQNVILPMYWGQNFGTDTLGIPGTNSGNNILYSGMPTFTPTGYTALGFPQWAPEIVNDNTWNYSANLGWVHGAHEFRWGFDMIRLDMNHWATTNYAGVRGNFNFDGSITTLNGGPSPNQYNAWAQFLLGLPTSDQKIIIPLGEHTREMQFAGYFHDRWQVSHKLTINLGLRYEWYPLMGRPHTGIEVYDPSTNNVLLGGVAGNPDDLGMTVSHKLFAPRVGIAYRFDNSTVVRAGYAIAYDPMPLSRPLWAFYPYMQQNTYVAPRSYVPYAPISQGIPVYGLPDMSTGSVTLPPATLERTLWNNHEFHRGYVQSINFMLERSLPSNFVVAAGYVGMLTTHQMVDHDINAAAPGTGVAGQPLYAAFGRTSVTNMSDGWLSANYNSLQATINRSFSKGLMVKGAYTFSKAIDMSDNDGWASLPLFNWGPEISRNRAAASYDHTHNLQMAVVYKLPFGSGGHYATKGFLSYLASGWQVSGMFGMTSGGLFSVTASGASLNAPDNTQTANQVLPEVAKLGGIGANTPFYNPLAFRAVTTVSFGNSGRDILRGPRITNLNSSLFRTFPISERFKLEFRAEACNLSNTPHFNNPSANVSNMSLNSNGSIKSLGNFMSITSTLGDPRQFRFGLHLAF
jgi:hypothetical protein